MDDRERQSREALERVKRDSETLGTSSLNRMSRRMTDHLAGRDAVGAAPDGGTDPIELWGRRIGRSLSLVGFIVLVYWLASQLDMI